MIVHGFDAGTNRCATENLPRLLRDHENLLLERRRRKKSLEVLREPRQRI
jgi:hypothetical protein